MVREGDTRALEILLVEDSPSDVLLTREALAHAGALYNLYVVPDGVEALAFLSQQGIYCHAPRPTLILLDLNLPRKDGREVLAAIKTDVRLQAIPVVVLTTSKAMEDVRHAYGLQANCYITKPMDFLQFTEAIRATIHFWCALAILP